jgi:5-methylcytosine-specific restriction endonuclease McrA
VAARFAGRKGRPFVRAQRQCFREETHCCLCGNYVDQTLPNYRSGQARSVHHLIPPDIAPELANRRDNMRLAHIGCNSRYGRGHLEGQGPKGGRAPRGVFRGRAHRVITRARGNVRVGASHTPDRDW